MTGSVRFVARFRLREERQFRALLKARRVQTSYFQVYAVSNGLPYGRLGVIISKRVAGRAVDRNFARRAVRERFRLRQADLRGLDVVVRLRRRLERRAANSAVEELTSAFSQLNS